MMSGFRLQPSSSQMVMLTLTTEYLEGSTNPESLDALCFKKSTG